MNVALIGRGGGVIASRGPGSMSWLPGENRTPVDYERWTAPSRAGAEHNYVARMVAAPDFYVIASFDDGPARAARLRFILLCWRRSPRWGCSASSTCVRST